MLQVPSSELVFDRQYYIHTWIVKEFDYYQIHVQVPVQGLKVTLQEDRHL